MDCHSCGMYIDESLSECPKCDAGVYAHNHAETITVDIAHNRQSVAQASTQFYDALESATLQQFGKLRIIVGSGLIKNDIGERLATEKWRGSIHSFDFENPNQGVYLIRLHRQSRK